MRPLTILIFAAASMVSMQSIRAQAPATADPALDEPALDPRIPEPSNPLRWGCHDRDWTNPRIDVSDDGYLLRSLSKPQWRLVDLADLRRELVNLPVSDWPKGA